MHPWVWFSGQLWPALMGAASAATPKPNPTGGPTASPTVTVTVTPTPLSTVSTLVSQTPVGENPLLVIVRFVVGIAVVFFLLWLVARWVRRSGLGDYTGPGLRILARAPLTRSSQVAVVEIGGRMFLVGAGDSAVTPIAELYDTDQLDLALQSEAAGAQNQSGGGSWGESARAALQKLRGNKTASGAAEQNPASVVDLKPVTHPASNTATKSADNQALRRYAENSYAQNSFANSALPTDKTSEAQMDRLARQLAAEFGAPLSEPRPGEQ